MPKRGSKGAIAVAVAAVVLFASQPVTATQAAPTPSPSPTPTKLADAKQMVRELEEQASEIGERYDEAIDELNKAKANLAALADDIAAQQRKVDALAEQVSQIALLQFRNRNLDTTVQLFTSGDPDSLLDRLSTASKFDQDMADTLALHEAEQARLADLQRSQNSEVAALAAQEKRMGELKQQIDDKVAAAQALVIEMTAEQRAALDAEDGGTAPFDPSELDGISADARALIAVKYAVSRVSGGQYVWGAEGPNNFDCSGLMLASYRKAGISLPHSSRAQSRLGRAVSRDELKPGDLIFWYHPIHHVGMYIGNGKIVHARNTRADLVVQTLNSYGAPYAGARRVVG